MVRTCVALSSPSQQQQQQQTCTLRIILRRMYYVCFGDHPFIPNGCINQKKVFISQIPSIAGIDCFLILNNQLVRKCDDKHSTYKRFFEFSSSRSRSTHPGLGFSTILFVRNYYVQAISLSFLQIRLSRGQPTNRLPLLLMGSA